MSNRCPPPQPHATVSMSGSTSEGSPRRVLSSASPIGPTGFWQMSTGQESRTPRRCPQRSPSAPWFVIRTSLPWRPPRKRPQVPRRLTCGANSNDTNPSPSMWTRCAFSLVPAKPAISECAAHDQFTASALGGCVRHPSAHKLYNSLGIALTSCCPPAAQETRSDVSYSQAWSGGYRFAYAGD